MYLHQDRENFRDLIEAVSNKTGRPVSIIEKDYYVTMILKKLSQQLDNVVFKGGTSLSKGYHTIDRFSEDIDITFDEHIGESRRKKLKNNILKGISEELGMPIINWDRTQSDRDYNAYLFSYNSISDLEDERMPQYVKLETALGSYAFPTQYVSIGNYIGDYMISLGKADLARMYKLDKFEMKLQSLERTFVDKIFALCDYYMQGKSKRYSRHLYDIYKLTPLIVFDDNFLQLIEEVRKHRSNMGICPSASEDISIRVLVQEISDNHFFEEDYYSITSYFTHDYVSYDEVINNLLNITKLYFK